MPNCLFGSHSFKHYTYWYDGERREQTTMELFAKLINPGDVVVEVGGHIGYIAVYFSHLVGKQGRVVVFEPGPNNFTLPTPEHNRTIQRKRD
jgi:predicted methyltransferase